METTDVETRALVRIGDLQVDEETGEIIEFPAGAGDQLAALVMRCRQAQDNADGWKQAEVLLKKAIGRLLDQAGAKSLSTEYGTAGWRGRTDTRFSLADFAAAAREMETPANVLLDVISLFGSVPLSKSTEEALALVMPTEVGEFAARKDTEPWVQIDKPRRAPPVVERTSA